MVTFYDEHTVFIYDGAYFHTAKGYFITDGTNLKDVSKKSEEFIFDKNSMYISKAISNKLFCIMTGL